MTDKPIVDEKLLDESEVYHIRKQKLADLRAKGFNFPNQFKREHLAGDLLTAYGDLDKVALAESPIQVAVAGRIVLRRVMGKATFFQIQESSGRIQIYARANELGDAYADFTHWDLGDIVGVRGLLFKTNTGELSVHAATIELLTKSLRPLPDKFHGLADQELRYRKRYVDLIANESSRQVFLTRTKLIRAFRAFMDSHHFLEVETPMMHPIPGGAVARPFITHHNTLDQAMYLRIAPELYLKRLVVGGFERVYEINRNFRNEGLSTRHNPEFTMVEFYTAYADYQFLMQFTEDLLRYLAQTVLNTLVIDYQGVSIDFSTPFVRLSVTDAILTFVPSINEEQLKTVDSVRALLAKLGHEYKMTDGLGKLQMIIFEERVEHLLIQPTFITDYPAEVSPLARRKDSNPMLTDRFEFFIGGREIANGFSELNDAEDQAKRFTQQVEEKNAGDLEAMHFDSDYIEALEYGLPPTAGEGIGIDRLVMLFTNAPSIRDVILFPHLRDQK